MLHQHKPENAIKKFKYTEKRVYIALKVFHEVRIGELVVTCAYLQNKHSFRYFHFVLRLNLDVVIPQISQ